MMLEALVRLGQEVGGADEVAQTHIDGRLIVEQAGRGQERAGLHELMTTLLQLRQRVLERSLISHVVADASGECRELRHDLRWDVVEQRRLGGLERCQGLLQRKGGTQQGPVPLQAALSSKSWARSRACGAVMGSWSSNVSACAVRP